MRISSVLTVALFLGATAAIKSPHERARRLQERRPKINLEARGTPESHGPRLPKHLNEKTSKFQVDPTGVPEVPFDIGESYAGTLENTPSGDSSLYFWYFPSENPAASNEITVWLNGGPGCSSMLGLIHENGPFIWRSGTYEPVRNPYSWVNLTNVVWIDQPAGAGFAPGPPTVQDENDVANEFNDFWKRFIDTFDLHNRDVYLTGESYAGQYIPYIADAMLEKEDTEYFNVKGVELINPSIGVDGAMIDGPAIPAMHHFQNILGLNESFVSDVTAQWEKCGYKDFMEEALTFPPAGPFKAPEVTEECNVWDVMTTALYYVNPCHNMYHVTDFCPFLWNIMGFPSLAGGPNNYFNRTDVQQAIHAPPSDYAVCGMNRFFPPDGEDGSPPSSLDPLPRVIEKTNNTIIAHGVLDFLLFSNGSLATIQNMTWNGLQGFQERPSENFFSPYHHGLAEVGGGGLIELPYTQDAGAGHLGLVHTERGLTFATVDLAGHEIPQYSPGAAYRLLELLLGRVQNVTEPGDFTTLPGDFYVGGA